MFGTERPTFKHHALKDSSSVTIQQAKQKRLEKQKVSSKKRKDAILNKRRKANTLNAQSSLSPSELFNMYIDQHKRLTELVQQLDVCYDHKFTHIY
jgi:hypothetical protein